jgi:hypothetical protein
MQSFLREVQAMGNRQRKIMRLFVNFGTPGGEMQLHSVITSLFLIPALFILVTCTQNQTKSIPETHPPVTAVSNPPTATPTATTVLHTPTPFPTDSRTFRPTAVTVTPTSAIFPVVDTAVAYVIVNSIYIEILSGPGFDYDPVDTIHWAEIIPVTGQSEDGEWWRVLCPDNIAASCWVYSIDTSPVDAPTLEAMLPDPAALNSASTTTVPSPDGRWQATAAESEDVEIVDYFDLFYTSLTVTDGTTSWIPIAKWQQRSSVHGYPERVRIVGWSEDGRFLYYTVVRGIDGCIYFNNAFNLVHLDVTDGTQSEILPDNTTVNLSMSPDGKTLVYVTYGQSELILRNMGTGRIQRIPLTNPRSSAQTSEILWSADGETAVFTLIHDTCLFDNTTHSSIIRIDAVTLTATPVIDNDNRLFRVLEWPDPAQNKVRVIDNNGNSWLLDVDSGELTSE